MKLRKVLLLLLVCSVLLVSIAGCTSSSSNPAPSTAPAVTSNTATTFDPILTKLAESLRSEYGGAVEQRRTNVNSEAVFVAFESDGRNITVEIRNEGSVEAANSTFETLSTCASGDINGSSNITYFGLQAAKDALGHEPTTINDVYCTGTDEFAGVDNEYIQYDQLFIQTMSSY